MINYYLLFCFFIQSFASTILREKNFKNIVGQGATVTLSLSGLPIGLPILRGVRDHLY